MVDKPYLPKADIFKEHEDTFKEHKKGRFWDIALAAIAVTYLGGLSALLVYTVLNKNVKEKSEVERIIEKYDTHIKDRKLDKYELPDLLEDYKKK